MMKSTLLFTWRVLSVVLLLGWTGTIGPVSAAPGSVGSIRFVANGEDFVRQGLVTKDGWDVSFEHVYVTLSGITAYQSDPPYDADSGSDVVSDVSVTLPGTYTIDLAAGGEDAEPVEVGVVPDALAGFYNAISFRMTLAEDGPGAGYSLVVQGVAEKEGEPVDFVLKFDDVYQFTCGEYIGDMRKGILRDGGTADLEMTFHFDHLFGDAGMPPDDGLNTDALGFDVLAALGSDGVVDLDMDSLEAGLPADDYEKLLEILPTLGHVGEGHCHSEMHPVQADENVARAG